MIIFVLGKSRKADLVIIYSLSYNLFPFHVVNLCIKLIHSTAGLGFLRRPLALLAAFLTALSIALLNDR